MPACGACRPACAARPAGDACLWGLPACRGCRGLLGAAGGTPACGACAPACASRAARAACAPAAAACAAGACKAAGGAQPGAGALLRCGGGQPGRPAGTGGQAPGGGSCPEACRRCLLAGGRAGCPRDMLLPLPSPPLPLLLPSPSLPLLLGPSVSELEVSPSRAACQSCGVGAGPAVWGSAASAVLSQAPSQQQQPWSCSACRHRGSSQELPGKEQPAAGS
jgi:hypothetical protein